MEIGQNEEGVGFGVEAATLGEMAGQKRGREIGVEGGRCRGNSKCGERDAIEVEPDPGGGWGGEGEYGMGEGGGDINADEEDGFGGGRKIGGDGEQPMASGSQQAGCVGFPFAHGKNGKNGGVMSIVGGGVRPP